ncbi:MAG TPA: hypothetical protein VFV38_09840 [Ktedonobacteraceae bacterium]|nr:hypothetical protein [Ktedonobacteraceae bacterium]
MLLSPIVPEMSVTEEKERPGEHFLEDSLVECMEDLLGFYGAFERSIR